MNQHAVVSGELSPEAFRDKVGYVLRRFNQALHNQVDDGLDTLGLTTSKYVVLSVLEKFPGCSNARLARAVSVTPQTMTRILNGLLADGFIRREASAHHGRVVVNDLTPAGRAVVRKAHPVIEHAEDRLFEPLTTEQRRTLLEQLWTCASASAGDVVLSKP